MNIIECKNICTGCSACVGVCPVDAIKMVENSEGFREPQIDFEKCVNCGKCLRVCPSFNRKINLPKDKDCYLIQNDDFKKDSSSGGAFATLATKFMQDGGYVCGVVYNENFEVEHIVSNTLSDIKRMQGSKYVQSNLKNCFLEIEEILKSGKKVLFSGTPCQVAGIKSFIKAKNISDENLLTCDLICYGVPTPKAWKKYLDEVIPKDEKILAINMREKGVGRSCYKLQTDKNTYCIPHSSSDDFALYMRVFFQKFALRKSCVKCLYTNLDRVGDLTLGDFWGIEKYNKNLNPQTGLSCVIVNSDKGAKFLSQNKFTMFKKVPLKYAKNGQPRLNFPTEVPLGKREDFFKNLDKMSLKENYENVMQEKSDCKIINYWFAVNYGAALTCYALKRFIEKQGYSVKTINYVHEKVARNRDYGLSKAKSFAEKFLNLTTECKDYADLKELNNNTDFFVVGSDQVWRHHLYKDHGNNIYQLNFAHNDKRKIAYSVSFGADFYDGDRCEKSLFKYLIKRFDAISVREKAGLDVLKNEFGINNAEHILDPVFTLDDEDLDALTRDKMPIDGKYVASFRYLSRINGDFCSNLEQKLAEKYNVPVKRLIYDKKCDIEEFVTFIKNCEYLVTDSFHAACFAILFKKPFVILGLADTCLTRMTSLIETFGLDKRILISMDGMKSECIDEYVKLLSEVNYDYSYVQEVIEREKEKSQIWFNNIFKQKMHEFDEKDEAISAMADQIMLLKDNLYKTDTNISIFINAPKIILALIMYKIKAKLYRNKPEFPRINEKLKFYRKCYKRLKALTRLWDYI